MNELKTLTDAMGINIFEVIDAAATKPFGFTKYYPGPGVGGHCIPVDPFYLTWKAKQLGLNTKFIKLAGEINDEMPKWIVKNISKIIPKKKKKLLIIGIAYKKNVDDLRESPILNIINKLEKQKNHVEYYDPFVPKLSKTRKFNFDKRSINLSFNKIKKFDAVIIGTDHDKINYNKIKKFSKLIIDLRGRYASQNERKIICL